MPKTISGRITYAQEKLIALYNQRQLNAWCEKNGLPMSVMYRIATGERQPTYKLISSMTHLVAPIEWLFFTDEKLPYKPKLLPTWDASKKCAFASRHRHDYRELPKKYGIPEISAYKMCVANSGNPTVPFMRECCKDTDPTEFFTESDVPESETLEFYCPERGDIVNVNGSLFLAMSKKAFSEKTGKIVCCAIEASEENGIKLEDTDTVGFVQATNIVTHSSSRTLRPYFIEKADEKTVAKALEFVKDIFAE